jgi:hypothetical protein
MLHGVETLADLQPNGDVPQEVPAINDGKPSRINGREYASNMSEKANISSSSTNADTPGSREVRKKSGGPKGKNAVRTKSGCYTCRLAPPSVRALVFTNTDVTHCRIRRKKCDEKPDADGRCETCVRLHLECLGFGVKRPEWLRVCTTVLVSLLS